MITNSSTSSRETAKQIRERKDKEEQELLKKACENRAIELFTQNQIKKWSNENQGLWFLPVCNPATGEIEKMAIMKPINRDILSYATTKLQDDGLYAFLEACMENCFIAGDREIITDDEFFIPAAMKFNSILEGKKASLLKR